MILKLAWRNIWRVKSRSFVVIGAVTIGIWAVLFLVGYMLGTVNTLIKNSIENQVSHLQVHHNDFKKDREVKFFMDDVSSSLEQIRTDGTVKGATSRTLVNGMITAPKGVRGVQIKGIDPGGEASVTSLDDKIVEGSYFDEKTKNPIIIGQELAEKLNIALRKKVVLTFQDVEGEMTYAAFRIIGFYKTHNSTLDELFVYIPQSKLNDLIGLEGSAHEIAILLDDLEKADAKRDQWQGAFDEAAQPYLVETYREIAPDINLYDSQMSISITIIMSIIMLALIFGIINTMLMAVMDRYRELGMLMSIGMNKIRVFSMIMLETIMLSLVALPIGLFAGWATIAYTGMYGIDLSNYADGLNQFGMSEIIYPSLTGDIYLQLAVMVVTTAILAAIYPAYKAIKLKPVEAIRKL
ncbi:MAG: FtsX-like permease family protein [Bacteroidota bacterium]